MHTATVISILLFAPFGTFAQRQLTSTDAKCGGNNGYTCLNSAWGSCCSQYGWCGSTTAYCGAGCNPKFGVCNKDTTVSSTKVVTSSRARTSSARDVPTRTPSSSIGPLTSSQPVTTDARCGPSFGGTTCQGSKWGNCCSQYSYCGSTIDYCNAKTCQKGFGQCNGVASSSRVSSTLATFVKSSSALSGVSRSALSTSATVVSPSTTSGSVAQSLSLSSAQPSNTLSIHSSQPSSSSSSATPSSSAMSSSIAISASSTTLSSFAGPSPSACPYYKYPSSRTCSPFQGSFNDACRAGLDVCQGDINVQCNSIPYGERYSTPALPGLSEDQCVTLCHEDSGCAGFWYNTAKASPECTFYSLIEGAAGVSTGSYTAFIKLCTPDSIASSSSSIASSSGTPSPSASSSSVVVQSSSVSTASSVTASPSPVPSTPSPISSSSSATPTPDSCPYYRYPSGQTCAPYQAQYFGLLYTVCDSTPQVCRDNIEALCFAKPSSDSVLISVDDNVDADTCIARCQANSTCVGVHFVDYSSQECYLYSSFGSIEGADVKYYQIFRKLCT